MSTHNRRWLVTLLCLPWCITSQAAELGKEHRPQLGQPVAGSYLASVVSPNGSGLPQGQGSVAEGETIYAERCAGCHGSHGRQAGNQLAGGEGSLAEAAPLKTIGSYWPYATTVFDYVMRAMPYAEEKSLSANEGYAITAYLLYLNDIVPADAHLDQAKLAKIRMPNRGGFRELPQD